MNNARSLFGHLGILCRQVCGKQISTGQSSTEADFETLGSFPSIPLRSMLGYAQTSLRDWEPIDCLFGSITADSSLRSE
jgi:hypothetical protein